MKKTNTFHHCQLVCCALLLIILTAGCQSSNQNEHTSQAMSHKDIQKVMDSHTPNLMAIEGVVGVYIGETEKGEPCIKVMVAEDTTAIRDQIPAALEGIPVIVVVSGEIEGFDG